MVGAILIITFILAGIFTGLNVLIPYSYSQYIAVAILACLDSVFGAFVANIDKKFKMITFVSGFFGNAIIAMLLVFIGNKLNVDLYLGAVIVFTGRLLNNFSAIRRHYIDILDEKEKKRKKVKKDKIKEINMDKTAI